jgi:hypothetical protein
MPLLRPSPRQFLPAWVPSAGKFASVSTSNPSSADPDPTNVAIYRGGNGFDALWLVWTGGAFAPAVGAYGSMLLFGGGNHAYDGNEVVKYDIAARTTSLLSQPDLYSSDPATGGTADNVDQYGAWPNGNPFPPHTYCTVEWIPQSAGVGALGAFVMLGHWQNNTDDNITTTQLWKYDISAGTWSRRQLQDGSMYVNYGGLCFDSSRNGLWILMPICGSGTVAGTGLQKLYFYSYNTDTLTQVTMAGTAISGGSITGGLYLVAPEYHAGRDCIVLPKVGSGLDLVCIDLAGLTVGVGSANAFTVTQSGTKCPSMWLPSDDPTIPYGSNGRFAYCSADGAMYVLNQYEGGACKLYKLTPPVGAITGTWTWSNETLTAQNAEALALRGDTYGEVADKVLMGRFRYVPLLKSFAITDGSALPVQLLRPAAFI